MQARPGRRRRLASAGGGRVGRWGVACCAALVHGVRRLPATAEPSPGSLDPACFDMLGYDGRQLAGHGQGGAAVAAEGWRPTMARPVAESAAGCFRQDACLPPAGCDRIVALVEELRLMPGSGLEQQLDSVDGKPEFQVDVFASQQLTDLVWPLVEQSVVPSLTEHYGLQLRQLR